MANHIKYQIYFLLILLIFGGVYLFTSWAERDSLLISSKNYTITLTENGFEPSLLEINTGDTVSFKSDRDQPFWPASDPHPVHTNYSSFDSMHPVPADLTWNFKFDRAGTWLFHDHLGVSAHGKIVVTNQGVLSNRNDHNCTNTILSDQCWQEQIKIAIEDGGLDAGWNEFTKLSEAGIPVVCHWASHLIGEETAKEYQKGHDLYLSDKTSYCGYGFFHGFMETLLRDNPDPATAVSFCDFVGKKLGNNAQDNCFHGVGHGFTEDPPPVGSWGDANAMLKPGLEVCQRLFGSTTNKWSICATGVYTVIISYMFEDKYGLTLDSDPFAFCRTQPIKYYEACFGEVGPKLDQIVKGDVARIPILMKDMPDRSIANLVMRSSIAAMMQSDALLPTHINYIKKCHAIPLNLQSSCMEGVVMGLAQHGEPGKEYVKVLNFCNSNELSEQEKTQCYKHSSEYFGRIYDVQKIRDICGNPADEYKDYCSNSS